MQKLYCGFALEDETALEADQVRIDLEGALALAATTSTLAPCDWRTKAQVMAGMPLVPVLCSAGLAVAGARKLTNP